jgi:hypothetical protein
MSHEENSSLSQEIRQQIRSLSKEKSFKVENEDDIVSEIFRVIQGHPLSVKLFVQCCTNDIQQVLNTKTVKEQLPHCVGKLVEDVLEETIFKQLQLDARYPVAKDILQYLAVPRYLWPDIPRHLLPDFLPAYAKKPRFFYARFFEEEIIFEREEGEEGIRYRLNPEVRHILLENMRLNTRDQLMKIRETLIKKYEEWSSKNQDGSQIVHFTEKLYHTAMLLIEKRTDSSVTKCLCEEMHTYLNTHFLSLTGENKQLLSHLREKLGAILN